MPFLAGYITPQDYGAVGDGVTDDTAAIQSALNAVTANGAVVYFSGTFKITASLSIAVTGTQIIGNGWGTQIQYDGSVVTTGAFKATAASTRVFMRDIRISQMNSSHLGTAIDASNFSNSVIERVLIDGGGLTGVAPLVGIQMNASTCHHNQVRACRINYGGATSRGVAIQGSAHSNTLMDIRFIPQSDDVNSAGVYITNSHSTTLIHTDVETGSGNAFFLDTAAHGTTLVNPYSDTMNIGLKITSGVVAPTVLGGTFQSSSTAAIQNNGAINPNIQNAWPNSGTTTYNHLEMGNTDLFTVNGLIVPASTYQESDHGFLAWSGDPGFANSSQITTNGTVYLTQVMLRYPKTISKGYFSISTAASGVTANQNFVGLYDSGGTLRASTAAGSIDAGITLTGPLTATFSSPYVAPAGAYWLAFLNNATTPTTLVRSSSFLSTPNANLTASNFRFAVNGTARTTLAASITPASNTTTGSISSWAAVS